MTIKDILGTEYQDFQEFCVEGEKKYSDELTTSDFVAFRVQYGVSRDYVNEIKKRIERGGICDKEIAKEETEIKVFLDDKSKDEVTFDLGKEPEVVEDQDITEPLQDNIAEHDSLGKEENSDNRKNISRVPFNLHEPLYVVLGIVNPDDYNKISIETLGYKDKVQEILYQDGRETVADVLKSTIAQIFDLNSISRIAVAKFIKDLKGFLEIGIDSFDMLMKQTAIPLIKLLNVSNPDRYKTASVTSIEFKNRFLNTLSQKKVKDIYTLISFTIDEIFNWDGMGVGTVYHSVRQLYDFFNDANRKIVEIKNSSTESFQDYIKVKELIDKRINKEEVDFEQLTEAQQIIFNKYNDAISVCGEELYILVRDNPKYFQEFCGALREFYQDTLEFVYKKQKVYDCYCKIPVLLRDKSIKLLSNIYRRKHYCGLIDFWDSIDKTLTVRDVWIEINRKEQLLRDKIVEFEKFFQWLKKLNIELIVSEIFSKDALMGTYNVDKELIDKYWIALEMRADGATLESVGTLIDATRERVRQIEKKYTRFFSVYYKNSEYDLIEVIYALRGGDNVLNFEEVKTVIGERYAKLLWLVLSKELLDCDLYKYSKTYNAVVFTSDANEEREKLQRALKAIPDYFFKDEFDDILDGIVPQFDVHRELLKMDVLERYRLYGKMYSRNALTVAFTCSYVLKERFPSGFKTADENEAKRFQSYLVEFFGEKGKMTARALDAKVGEIGVLCDRGKYIHPSYISVDKWIIDEVNAYIENSPKNVLTYAELYDAYRHIFEGTQIVNRFILQGVLKLYGCNFTMTRDYVTKESGRSLTDEFEAFAKELGIFHKNDFFAAFPAMSDANLGMLIGRCPTVFGIDNGMYMHSSALNLYESDYVEIREYLERVCSLAPVNSRFLFDEFSYKFVDFMVRNEVNSHTKLFGILFYMFAKEFNFSRPYISKEQGELTNKSVILHHFGGVDTITIEEAINICVENGIRYFSSGMLIKNVSPEYIRIDENVLMRRELTGINDDVLLEVATQVVEKIETNGYCASSTFNDFLFFPTINIEWNPYLLESVMELTSNIVNTILIPTTTYLSLTHIFVGEQYADDEYQEFVLKLLDEAYDKDFFATKAEMREWLNERGLINNNLPNFLDGTQYYYTDENGLLIRRG
ncbi:MAG: hypothetical protein IJ706_09130 [Clostridia bacterium]|nr:hypothetical protein [Clostridia bacterium]